MTENITRIERRIDDIERNMEQKMTQQLQEHKTQVEQQIHQIRNENQEIATKLRTETKEVVREEMEIVQSEVREHLEKSEQIIRQHQVVVAQEIKTLNSKVNNDNKKNSEQIQKLTEHYEDNCTEVDGQLTQIKEDVRCLLYTSRCV